MQQVQISSVEAGQRFDKFLGKYFPQAPKSFFYKMLRKKNITLNGKKAAGNERLEEGDSICFYLSDETIQHFRISESTSVEKSDVRLRDKLHPYIVFEDDELLVINKPAGMLSQKAGKDDITLVEYIEAHVEGQRKGEKIFKPGICNRLDRNTTGLIMAGKTVHSLQYLNLLFKERDVRKYYLCLVKGSIDEAARIDAYLIKDGERNQVKIVSDKTERAVRIVTEYEPAETGYWDGSPYTLLKMRLVTGKPHQLRAHLQSIGHPVVGDAKYGDKQVNKKFSRDFGIRHQLLHAWKLEIPAVQYIPEKYRLKCFTADIPEAFGHVLGAAGIKIR